jgi:hypothetical protein
LNNGSKFLFPTKALGEALHWLFEKIQKYFGEKVKKTIMGGVYKHLFICFFSRSETFRRLLRRFTPIPSLLLLHLVLSVGKFRHPRLSDQIATFPQFLRDFLPTLRSRPALRDVLLLHIFIHHFIFLLDFGVYPIDKIFQLPAVLCPHLQVARITTEARYNIPPPMVSTDKFSPHPGYDDWKFIEISVKT